MTTFTTIDIVLAAYLKTRGYILHAIQRQGNRGTFVFEDVPNELISEYGLGNSRVEPLAFNWAIRNLNTAVRSLPEGYQGILPERGAV
jgi:hypothetical protein